MVPSYEVEDARISAGIFRLSEWWSLTSWERAAIVAHRRVTTHIKNHAEEAMQEAAKKKAEQEARNTRGRKR